MLVLVDRRGCFVTENKWRFIRWELEPLVDSKKIRGTGVFQTSQIKYKKCSTSGSNINSDTHAAALKLEQPSGLKRAQARLLRLKFYNTTTSEITSSHVQHEARKRHLYLEDRS